jgi:hypothetical protein
MNLVFASMCGTGAPEGARLSDAGQQLADTGGVGVNSGVRRAAGFQHRMHCPAASLS